jgi:hypothetical protein
MKTQHAALDALGEWVDKPHIRLRKYQNGTLFLLQAAQGAVHVCELVGNMEKDENWKAQRLSDLKIISLDNLRQGALAFILTGSARTA